MGVRFYTGYATIGEYVVVRREPSNPYDSNALRVENVQRDQIGHIPRAMASKLAKYMVWISPRVSAWNLTAMPTGFRGASRGRLSHRLRWYI